MSATENPLIDVHCHRLKPVDGIQLLNLELSTFDTESSPPQRFSTGIHPWHIDVSTLAQQLAVVEKAAVNPNLLAIGECGLDKAITTPMALQIEILSAQIALAERHRKPLIIHCVKAFNELLQLKRTLAQSQIWIVHGFNAHPVVADQCLKAGCYLSFGHALLRDTSKARASVLQTPIDRLFLETDDRNDVTIGEIYAAAAKILALQPYILQRHIVANFHRVFSHD